MQRAAPLSQQPPQVTPAASKQPERVCSAASEPIPPAPPAREEALHKASVSFRAATTARNPPPTECASQVGGGSFAVGACPERAKRVEWAAQDDAYALRHQLVPLLPRAHSRVADVSLAPAQPLLPPVLVAEETSVLPRLARVRVEVGMARAELSACKLERELVLPRVIIVTDPAAL